jgi:hypothetical protein
MTAEENPNAEVPSRGVLWFAAPAMILFTAFMAFFFNDRGWRRIDAGFVLVSAAVSLGLLLTLVNARRYWWGLRLVTFIIFALYFYYLVDECFIQHKPLQIGSPGETSPYNAVLGFLFFGLPSLIYTLWGSVWGKLGHQHPQQVTRLDVLTWQLMRYSRWLFLALMLALVVTAALRKH